MTPSTPFFLVTANALDGALAPIGAWTLQTWHPAAVCFTALTTILCIPVLGEMLFLGDHFTAWTAAGGRSSCSASTPRPASLRPSSDVTVTPLIS